MTSVVTLEVTSKEKLLDKFLKKNMKISEENSLNLKYSVKKSRQNEMATAPCILNVNNFDEFFSNIDPNQ